MESDEIGLPFVQYVLRGLRLSRDVEMNVSAKMMTGNKNALSYS